MVKNADEFIHSKYYKNFIEASCRYLKLIKDIQILNIRKEELENAETEKDVLNFNDQLDLRKILKNLIKETNDAKYLDIDLKNLIYKLESNFGELNEYIHILNSLESAQEEINRIYDEISFDNFKGESYKHHVCFNNHFIVQLEDDELMCLKCGATTKDYNLTKEQIELLKIVARRKGLFIDKIRKDQIPFIKVIIQEQEYYKAHRKPLSEFAQEERSDWAEEYYLNDSGEISDIRMEMKKAQLLDEMKYKDPTFEGMNPKYLSDYKASLLLGQLEEQIKTIKESDSAFKELLLEQCKMAIFEILILGGYNIPNLYKFQTEEKDKIAFVKAYYNLSNQYFRINSGYFEKNENEFNIDFDAATYECRTMDPEINQKILDLKLKK